MMFASSTGSVPSLLKRMQGWLVLCALLGLTCLLLPSVSGQSPPQQLGPQWSCDSAEECFRSVAAIRDNRATVERRDEVLATKIERLRAIMERYPASLWAKRAGLLLGILLTDREPAEAIRYLRSAQRDFPQLEDYFRLWIGDSLVKLNDGAEAAKSFESIREAVPDSSLLVRGAYRTGETYYGLNDCAAAIEWFTRALALNDKDRAAPSALVHVADCHDRAGRTTEARTAFKQAWIRFPHTGEAREARARLDANGGGEAWTPSADDHYHRAQAFLGLAMQAEAIEELRRVLSLEPQHPRRYEARLKLGIAQTRLKQYDLARETFRSLSTERVPESNEAQVWLSRVYLRQGLGDKLLELARRSLDSTLTNDQKAMVQLFAGVWLEDQNRFDDAIGAFRRVAKYGESASQRAEGLWRVGWAQYRTAQYAEAAETFKMVAAAQVSAFEPQALYWLARAADHDKNGKPHDYYNRVCQRQLYSYYCQLAMRHADVRPESIPEVVTVSTGVEAPSLPENRRLEIERHPAYRRAVELKILGLTQDAARELATLTEQYSRDEEVLLAFSALLNEVGAYYPALRLAKTHFRDKLERGGAPASSVLWTVAYPTGLLPMIQAQGVTQVNPYLAAAIIREESQYDERAVSMVGAVGLMQLMPATANQVAQRFGLSAVERDDLFDQGTNIGLGVRYLGQLLDQFSGNVAYAVAAYNAGPTAVTGWISTDGKREQDEFIELIPYQETRLYVKRVLRSYGEYVRLHRGSS
ncbi:MAG: transglycosylase SLT domain-containing protein [Nitrospira sp.]